MNEEKFITVVVDLNGHMAAMVLLTERKFGLIRSRRRPLYNDQNLQSLSLDINVCANAVQYINGGLTVSMKHLTQSSIVLFEEKSPKNCCKFHEIIFLSWESQCHLMSFSWHYNLLAGQISKTQDLKRKHSAKGGQGKWGAFFSQISCLCHFVIFLFGVTLAQLENL